jgi:hypothetical protein
VITDSPGYIESIDLLPPLGSKHATLFVEFKISYLRDNNFKRHVWDYNKGNYNALNDSIKSHSWENILNANTDIHTMAANWTSSFLQLCKNSIPNRFISVKPRDLPWINHDCKYLIKVRNRLYKKISRTKLPSDEFIWKNKAREVRCALNTARLNYRQKLKDTLSDPTLAPKKYWSLVKRIYGSKKGMGIPVIEIGDKHLNTSSEKAIAFTDFFQEHQTLNVPPGHQLPALVMHTEHALEHISTTPCEVKKILNSLVTKSTQCGWYISQTLKGNC